MKKALSLLAIVALSLGTVNAYAQEDMATEEVAVESAASETMDSADAVVDSAAATTDSAATEEAAPAEEAPVEEVPAEKGFTQILKEKFIEGGAFFMSFVLLALVLGLALVIERIIYLTFAQTNTEKLLEEVEGALNNGGVEAAKEVCRNTRGPVATIFFEGLISPAASIASNAPIIPITVPMKPSIGAKAMNNEIQETPFSNFPFSTEPTLMIDLSTISIPSS